MELRNGDQFETVTFRGDSAVAVGDVMKIGRKRFDIVERLGSTTFCFKPWPWWKYLWAPFRQFVDKVQRRLISNGP